jgi:hypothetical protein
MALICIAGEKQHGKDTVTKMMQFWFMLDNLRKINTEMATPNRPLQYQVFCNWSPEERVGHSHWKPKQYAEKPKEIVAILLGCKIEDFEDNNFKEKPLGEEWRVWYIYNSITGERLPHIYASEGQAHIEKGYQPYPIHLKVDSYIPTPRDLLKIVGTGCGRNLIHPNIWVMLTFKDYKPLTKIITSLGEKEGKICIEKRGHGVRGADGNWYVPDEPHIPEQYRGAQLGNPYFAWTEWVTKDQLEYPNWLITDGRYVNEFLPVLNRGGKIFRVFNPRVQSTDTHSSETEQRDFKGYTDTIINDGSLDELLYKVKEVMIHHKLIKDDQEERTPVEGQG